MPFFSGIKKHFGFTLALLFLVGCSSNDIKSSSADAPEMDSLVSVQWLNDHLSDRDLVVLDCTVLVKQRQDGTFGNESGRASYEEGHIPGAGFADLLNDLSNPDNPFDMGMPSPKQFSRAIGDLGIGNDTRVVLYSSSYAVFPSYVWWLFRWAGYDQVALLDGGLKAWQEEGFPLSTGLEAHPAREFAVSIRPELISDRDDVLAAIQDDEVSLIDAMPDAHYQGQFSLYERPGHITSATNMPAFDLLDEVGKFRSQDELDMMYDGDRDAQAITYCGGGIAASSVAYSMVRLGFTNVSVYMGSLEEWAPNPENPMTTGYLAQ